MKTPARKRETSLVKEITSEILKSINSAKDKSIAMAVSSFDNLGFDSMNIIQIALFKFGYVPLIVFSQTDNKVRIYVKIK